MIDIFAFLTLKASSQAGINVVESVNVRAGNVRTDSSLFAQPIAVNGVPVSWFA
jgi:hypothetical protein